MSIIFSKSFISFNKDINEDDFFLRGKNTILIVKDAKMEYDLLTHTDIEELSYFPNEREVLFFPFFCFWNRGF